MCPSEKDCPFVCYCAQLFDNYRILCICVGLYGIINSTRHAEYALITVLEYTPNMKHCCLYGVAYVCLGDEVCVGNGKAVFIGSDAMF